MKRQNIFNVVDKKRRITYFVVMGTNVLRKVTKSNHLVEASYKLSLNEQRLALLAISKLDSRKPLPKNGIRITAVEFAESFKGSIEPKTAYNVLKDAARDLYERSITKIEGRRRRDTRWLSEKEEYESHDGYVTIFFSDRIAPYLVELNQHFSSFTLKQVAGLRSVYSIRLFEMLIRFQKTGFLTVSLDDFKDRLEISPKYKWHDVRKRVIDPAVKELRERGQLDISYTPNKKGRSIVGVEFHFRLTDQMAMNL